MIKTVFFDLDGTLVDSAPGVDFAAQAAWAFVVPGGHCPPMRALMGPPLREMFRRAMPQAGADVLSALERSFRAAYDSEGWKRTVLFPGVLETLVDLRDQGVRCFGVTNKRAFPTRKILKHCQLEGLFGEFLSPDSRQPSFPSKVEAVNSILIGQRIKPISAMIVGDTLEDALTAESCGLHFAAFAGGYGWETLRTQKPNIMAFNHFRELLKLVQNRFPLEPGLVNPIDLKPKQVL